MDSFLDAILNNYKERHLSHKQTNDALSYLFTRQKTRIPMKLLTGLNKVANMHVMSLNQIRQLHWLKAMHPLCHSVSPGMIFFEMTELTFSELIKSTVINDIGAFYPHIL